MRTDPIRTLRAARRAIDAAALIGLAALATWALVPRDAPSPRSATAVEQDAPAEHVAADPFPVAAFDLTLWHEPPEPVVVTPPKPPEMPRLELVGISRSGPGYRAMIYDPATDELLTVGAGDRCGVARVVSVDADRVRCEAHGRPFELSLAGKEGE